MATLLRFRKSAKENNDVGGSGGKIMRGRRVPDVRSPYTRPPATSPPPPSSPSQNPSRLLGLISPASRMITGAAKMISGVFFPDSPVTSSSSEDDSDDDDDISSQGDDRLYQNGATSEANEYTGRNLQLTVPNNEAKLVIEQLLTQQTFSREECNKFVRIIESRVLESPVSREGASRSMLADRVLGTSIITLPGASQSDRQARNSTEGYSYLGNGFDSPSSRIPAVGEHVPDICSTAVMEAKKWVQQRKTESYSQLDKSQGIFPSDPLMLSNVTEGELGSPVLMAKSYMKSRPVWASPTSGKIGFHTTSPSGMSHSNNSKDLKRSSIALDSQNTLDGSRRVRFKSAEDTDTVQPLSAQYSSQKDDSTSAEAGKRDAELGSRIHFSDSSPMAGSVKHSAMPADLAKNNGGSLYDGSGDGALSNSPDALISASNQDLDGPQTVVGGGSINVVQNLAPETLDGPPDQSAVIVNSEVRCTTTEAIKPAIHSDSNDYPGVNGPNESSMQPEGIQAMESSQRHSTEEQSNERSSNVSWVKETQASEEVTVPPISNIVLIKDSQSSQEEEDEASRKEINGVSSASSLPENSKPATVEGSCELLSEYSVEIPENKEKKKGGRPRKQVKEEASSVSSPEKKRRISTRVVMQPVNSTRGGRGGRGSATATGRGRGRTKTSPV